MSPSTMPVGGPPQRVLTVSELTLMVRDRLEHQFSDVWVEGEVSNLRTPASGHVYLTLKDSWSQIRAVLFRAAAQRVKFEVREGLQMLVRGRLTVYEPRGEYQIVLDYLEPKGMGALQLRFEQLKEKLEREGLFAPARKRPLPLLPRRVGIVTSLTGAAVRDMITIIRRRCPIVEIIVRPVSVQGDAAASEIAEGITDLAARGDLDVMIVGRGGGSWEDLWCFNEEVVVRAIAASKVPVVSAVGHEIDYTLADFAADLRAPTPSAAAEIVVPVMDDLRRTLVESMLRQRRAVGGRLELLRTRVESLRRHLPLVRVRVLRYAQRVDDLRGDLASALRSRMGEFRHRLTAHRHVLGTLNPLAKIRGAAVLAQQIAKRLEQAMLNMVAHKREASRACAGLLDSLSPLAILARGYSIVHHEPSGAIVRDAAEVAVRDEIRARLAKGELRARVTDVKRET